MISFSILSYSRCSLKDNLVFVRFGAASFLEVSDLSVTDGVFFREAVIFALPAHSVSLTDFAEFANEPCSR